MKTKINLLQTEIFHKTAVALGLVAILATPVWADSHDDEDEEDIEWIEEVIEIQELIKAYDQDQDQLLSESEIQQALTASMKHDSNSDQQLSLAEFEGLWAAETGEYAANELALIDKNADNTIAADELAGYYTASLQKIFDKECIDKEDILNTKELSKEAAMDLATMDVNRDGQLNLDELSQTSYSDMVETFQELDQNEDSQLTAEEMKEALNELAEAAEEVKKELPVDC
jgi:Ca2+-binding EF-hand superfamily protein